MKKCFDKRKWSSAVISGFSYSIEVIDMYSNIFRYPSCLVFEKLIFSRVTFMEKMNKY